MSLNDPLDMDVPGANMLNASTEVAPERLSSAVDGARMSPGQYHAAVKDTGSEAAGLADSTSARAAEAGANTRNWTNGLINQDMAGRDAISQAFGNSAFRSAPLPTTNLAALPPTTNLATTPASPLAALSGINDFVNGKAPFGNYISSLEGIYQAAGDRTFAPMSGIAGMAVTGSKLLGGKANWVHDLPHVPAQGNDLDVGTNHGVSTGDNSPNPVPRQEPNDGNDGVNGTPTPADNSPAPSVRTPDSGGVNAMPGDTNNETPSEGHDAIVWH